MKIRCIAVLFMLAGLSACTFLSVKPQRHYPDEIVESYAAALSALKEKHWSEARKLFAGIADREPEMVGAYMNLGIIARHNGDNEGAVQAFLRVIELDARNAEAYNELGVMARENGDFQQAEMYYKKAMKVNPDYSKAMRNIAILYDLYLFRPAEALTYYRKYQSASGENIADVKIWIEDLQSRLQ